MNRSHNISNSVSSPHQDKRQVKLSEQRITELRLQKKERGSQGFAGRSYGWTQLVLAGRSTRAETLYRGPRHSI